MHTWCLWRMLDPWELRIQMVVSSHVDAGNKTQVPCTATKHPSLLSHLSSPYICFMFYKEYELLS